MGDFSQERSLSKYVSRLGLAFTTTECILIPVEEQMIPEIKTEDGKFMFSDGIGKISLSIAGLVSFKKVYKKPKIHIE